MQGSVMKLGTRSARIGPTPAAGIRGLRTKGNRHGPYDILSQAPALSAIAALLPPGFLTTRWLIGAVKFDRRAQPEIGQNGLPGHRPSLTFRDQRSRVPSFLGQVTSRDASPKTDQPEPSAGADQLSFTKTKQTCASHNPAIWTRRCPLGVEITSRIAFHCSSWPCRVQR